MRIFPLGDSALTIEFGSEISLHINDKAHALARHFTAHPFPGLIEAVPAYSSVSLFYETPVVSDAYPKSLTAFAAVSSIAEKAAENLEFISTTEKRIVEIPIQISDTLSPDLEGLCEFSKLTRTDVLDIFLSCTYRVYMLGFLPGFAYMGDVDERIAAPRLKTPRTKVPKGSVGIAGKQTGIYPLESPGGWNIIGRTDLEMFDPTSPEPCLLRPGDEVAFVLKPEL
jgi:inhibitor of KinA